MVRISRFAKELVFLSTLTLIVPVLPSKAEHRLIQAPINSDAMNTRIYELENGLRIYLTQNSQEPRFYAEIVVRAGSKHDPADATGIAHYLEHMLFKGASKIGTIDWEKEKVELQKISNLYENRRNT